MMRLFFILTIVLSFIFVIMKWKYRILNTILNWQQGRKYLIPIVVNMLLWMKKKRAV
ncbi:hypothetical protein [Oceanobacillus sp. J11TS1]|uniref:hypothetical protein n=1 Tax=Oceanobacillus sp. J11TS1 TaxID=2807191 RepID=UPI001B2BA359|nr:hypothetical protein [Oceanobacillus sp. J11TS1]GIO23132.1 hypothetical protein J11TS1_17130 [Oceanobacillus sp. J11TS1]